MAITAKVLGEMVTGEKNLFDRNIVLNPNHSCGCNLFGCKNPNVLKGLYCV